MRKLLLLFGLALLISCVEVKVQDRDTSSKAIAEGTQTTSESSANEDTVADTWGQIIEAPPETFFAADLSDDVRSGLTNTLLVATSGDVPAAVEFGRVAAAPVNTLRQQTHRCQEISVCF